MRATKKFNPLKSQAEFQPLKSSNRIGMQRRLPLIAYRSPVTESSRSPTRDSETNRIKSIDIQMQIICRIIRFLRCTKSRRADWRAADWTSVTEERQADAIWARNPCHEWSNTGTRNQSSACSPAATIEIAMWKAASLLVLIGRKVNKSDAKL